METPPEPQGDSPAPVKDEEIDTNWDEAIETFDNMELREELLRGIYAYQSSDLIRNECRHIMH
jgi:translation initiation factor 4A